MLREQKEGSMKKIVRLFLLIVLSCIPAVAAGETGMFQSAVPDQTGVEITRVPANRIVLSYTLNNESTDVLAEKAAARTRVLDRKLQSAVFSAFSSEQLSFTADWVSLAPVSQGPELLAYQNGIMPVQQGATRKGDRNRFAGKNTESAVIPVQYADVERVAYSRIEAKRSNDRKNGGSTWIIRTLA